MWGRSSAGRAPGLHPEGRGFDAHRSPPNSSRSKMAGNITTIEQIKRLKEVKRLKSEGQTNQQVSDEIGISLTSVQRATQQLKKIDVSDLSPKDIAEQRGTLDLEFQEIAEYAKVQFEEWKEEKPSVANSFLRTWASVTEQRAKLFGLDAQKIESFTQINQLNQYDVPDKIAIRDGEKIAEAIKKSHETKVS